jgi:hypothetical protein
MGTAAAPSPKPKSEPVDWHVVIRAAVGVALAEERRFNRKVLAGVLAEVNDDLQRAVPVADGRARRPQATYPMPV